MTPRFFRTLIDCLPCGRHPQYILLIRVSGDWYARYTVRDGVLRGQMVGRSALQITLPTANTIQFAYTHSRIALHISYMYLLTVIRNKSFFCYI